MQRKSLRISFFRLALYKFVIVITINDTDIVKSYGMPQVIRCCYNELFSTLQSLKYFLRKRYSLRQ